MSEEIIKVFDYIGDKLGVAIDYTQENIQPYLEDLWHRFITYELVINIMYSIIGAVLLLVGFVTIYKYLKASKLAREGKADGFFYGMEYSTYYGTDKVVMNDRSIAVFIIMTFVIMFGFALFIVCTPNIIELLILPEKYMLHIIQNY